MTGLFDLQESDRHVYKGWRFLGSSLGKYQQREVLRAAVAGKSKKEVPAFFCSGKDRFFSAKEYMARKIQLRSAGHTQVLLVIWQRHGSRQDPTLQT